MTKAQGHRLHLLGSVQRRRSARAAVAPVRATRNGETAGLDAGLRALLHGRPRHAAGKRRGFHRASSSRRCSELGVGKIASVSGRYYAMDRDKRWERIERAFGAMVLGNGAKARSASRRCSASYERGVTDEFIEPVTIVDERNEPVGLIRDDDSVIMYNYRADRAREMTMALTERRSRSRRARWCRRI